MLVNPATSFDSSPWPALGPLLPSLPAEAYRLLPIALAPVLSNPLAMVRRAVGPGEPLPVQLADLMHVSASGGEGAWARGEGEGEG